MPSATPAPNIRGISQSTTTSTQRSLPPSASLRLFLSATNLPEPDARSRAIYAVLYTTTETLALPSPTASLSDGLSPTPPSPARRTLKLRRTTTALIPDTALVQQLSDHTKRPNHSTNLRAPHLASRYTAPKHPTVHVRPDGVHLARAPWRTLGCTDVARKQGRDLEFARAFFLTFHAVQTQLVRVAFYDCTKQNLDKQRLIGTADFELAAVVAKHGKLLSFPLRFVAISDKDLKKSCRIPIGSLLVTAEIVYGKPEKYRLDVQCTRILKSTLLSYTYIKRLFYTIHAVLDENPKTDVWTLIYRSQSVQMIHLKKDGGSLEYNYFSNIRVLAMAGNALNNNDDATDNEHSSNKSFIHQFVAKALGSCELERFFSLPGADVELYRSDLPLRLTLFADNGTLAGYEMVANADFSFAELNKREVGGTSPIKMRSNIVGKSVLKYKERSPDPHYFCLSLLMHGDRR